jgi:hypothetical protein
LSSRRIYSDLITPLKVDCEMIGFHYHLFHQTTRARWKIGRDVPRGRDDFISQLCEQKIRRGTEKDKCRTWNSARGGECSSAAWKTRVCSGKIHCLQRREIINGVRAVTQAAAQMYFWRRPTHFVSARDLFTRRCHQCERAFM